MLFFFMEAQLEQQEKDLAVLKLKSEMEAREAERCMQEMLIQDNLQVNKHYL